MHSARFLGQRQHSAEAVWQLDSLGIVPKLELSGMGSGRVVSNSPRGRGPLIGLNGVFTQPRQ